MDEPGDDWPPQRSRQGLLTAAIGMLAFMIFTYSWIRGWRPW